METIETLQTMERLYSETQILEFANADGPGYDVILNWLRETRKYSASCARVLKSVILADSMRNGW